MRSLCIAAGEQPHWLQLEEARMQQRRCSTAINLRENKQTKNSP